MKAAFLIICLLLSLCAGAVGSLLVAPGPSDLPQPLEHTGLAGPIEALPDAGRPEPVSAQLSVGPEVPAEVQARLDQLSAELADLRDEVEDLRSDSMRTPVLAAESLKPSSDATIQLSTKNREAIRTVLEEENERREAERDAERRKREEEWVLSRAKQVADELGLGAADQKQLADVMTVERLKRREIFEELRAVGGPDMRDQMRTAMQDIRDWKTNELATKFGPDIAKQIEETDGGGRGWGGDGGGGRRRGGQN